MPTLPCSADSLAQAAAHLRAGGLVAFPTETVYGLAALPEFESSLFAAKGRQPGKPIARLAGQAEHVPLGDDPRAQALAAAFWPGPLTLVLGGIGYRVPDHPAARALLDAVGVALPTTSANQSGEPDACSAAEAAAVLPDDVLILDDGSIPGGVPSTVVILGGEELQIARVGAISSEDIFGTIG